MTSRTSLLLVVACAIVAACGAGTALADGRVARSAHGIDASRVNAGGQRQLVANDQGGVDGTAGSGFTAANGAQGLRSGHFTRSADGSVQGEGQARVTGADGGTAERNTSFSRDTAGNAPGERSTTATNANTGVTFNGSTTYSRESGISRSAGCVDAAGNSVACGAAR
jgi:hypothetical protein